MQDIFNEIANERNYQRERWGDEADVTINTPNDFVAYITHYASRWFNGGFEPYPSNVVDAYRTSMIKVAALAVAAIEALDKQRANSGRAFFEKDESTVAKAA